MDRDKPQARAKPGPLGNHPVSTAVGGVTGAVTGGAVAGSAAGPVGAAVGAVFGAAVGSAGGKLIADMVDPRMERDFWARHDLADGHVAGDDLEAVLWANDLAEPEPGEEGPA
jgi:phage tail tape-measure protein